MPDFKIKTPDGRTVTVRGATAEGAIAYLAQQDRGQASAAPAEVNPEGTGFDRAVRRGAYQTASALPTALATADARMLADKDKLQSPGGSSAIKYDELMRAGVPQGAMASRGVNLEDDQGTARLMGQYGVSPQAQVNYGQVVDKRLENANSLKTQEDVYAAFDRIKANTDSVAFWRKKAADLPMSPGAAAYAQELAEAPDDFKGWLSTVTNDPVGFMTFLGETVAESAPQMAAGIATTAVTGNPVAGATVMSLGGLGREYSNEVNSFLSENGIDLSNPEQAATLFKNPELMDQANERGLTRGLVIAAADFAGQGLVAQQVIRKSLTRQTTAQGLSETAGESAATAAVGDKQSFKENATEGLAGGASTIPEAMVAGQAPWRSKIEGDPAYGGAAADLARTLREISEAQGNNLKDVRAGGGAKATLEAAHEKISGQISAIANNKDVKARLSPKNVATLEDLLGTYALAQTAIRQGKNKVKSKVTKENADAIVRLLGPTQEAAQLQQLFDQGDVLTDLFQDGLKGGVSQFTDFLNPFTDNSGNYDPNRSLSTIGSLYGASVVGPLKSAGIVAAGRAFDAATGRRSKVNRFVTKLEKLVGQDAPQGPSLIAAAALENQQAEQAKADDAAAKAAQEAEDANIVSTLAGMTGNATDGSPLGTVAVGTGIPAEEIQTVVSELRLKHPADSKNPNDVAVNKVLDDAQAGLNGEQRPIRALTQLVNIVNDHLNASLMDGGSSVQRTSLPDGDLARAKAIQMGNAPKMDAAPAAQSSPAPNVDTTAPAQPTVNGNQTTTSENYQAGIQANRDTALKLQEQVLDTVDLQNRQASNRPGGKLTPTMLEDEAQALYVALEAVQTENMSIEAMEEVQQLLIEEGVAQENVDKFYKPYIDRVRLQQKRKASMLKQAQATQEAISDDARVVPVPYNNAKMQEVFGVTDPVPGGNYIDLDTKQDVTGTTYTGGSVKVVDGKPVLETNDTTAEPATKADGPKVKVNLFKQKAGWKWIDYDGPATVVSTTIRGKHVYSLDTDLQNPVSLETYPNQPSEPRLRPTTQGEVQTGNVIGNISVRGKPHPVYDKVTVSTPPQADDSRSIPEGPFSGPALNTTYNPLQVSSQDLNSTNIEIMPSQEDLAAMKDGTYKPAKKQTLVEFAQQLQQRWEKATGRTEPFEQTAENVDQIARLMATEAATALRSDSNAIGWYDRKLKAAKAVVSLVDPRVTQSPRNELAFDFALAVTSNGQAVADNFEYAMMVFQEYIDTGRMPTETWIKGGERNQAMVDAFAFFNTYEASGQNMPLNDFLDQDFSVSELNSYMARFNSDYGTEIKVPSSEGASEMVKGSYIVGPKIGQGFYQNIRGNYDPLTMDIWWMRMWNRLTGRAFEDSKDIEKNRSTIRSGIKSADDLGKRLIKETLSDMGINKSDLKDDTVLDSFVSKLDKRYQSFYRKAKKDDPKSKPPKPQLFKSTGTMVKNMVPQLQAQPKNAGERSYMRTVTKEAISKLKEIGIDISTADFQALMWYPEKQLFRKGGVAPGRGSDNDYLDAAKMLAEKKGISNEQIEQALPASDGGGTVDNIPGSPRANGDIYSGTDGTEIQADNSIQPALLSPPGPAGGRTPRASDGGASKGRTLARVALAAVKKFVLPVKVAFQVGKRGTPEENGIQSIDQALSLAHTLGITVRLFDSQGEMYASRLAAYGSGDPTAVASFYRKGPEAGGKGAEGTVFGLNPGAMLDDGGSVSNIQALSDLIHEIAHGMTLSPLDLNGSQVDDTLFTNPLTGESDRAPMGSFAGSAMRPLLEQTGDADIMAELDNLQLNVDTYTTKDPSQRHALREVRKLSDNLKDWKAYYKKQFDAGQISQAEVDTGVANREEQADYYTNYMQSVRELAVDPVLVYLINPKLAKAVMPKTAALIRQQFNNAGNNKVKFFNHPAAIVMATVMAMLAQAMAEEEEEKQRMQMPPGALSPPPPGMGALSA